MPHFPRFLSGGSAARSRFAVTFAITTFSIVFAGCAIAASSGHASQTVEKITNVVDVRFAPGPGTLLPGTDDAIETQPLVDGKATFTKVSQLQGSDYYVGYIVSMQGPVIQMNERETSEGVRAKVVCTTLGGFIELESGKYSPVINVNEDSAEATALGEWQWVPLHGGKGNMGFLYFRWRQVDASGNDINPGTILSSIPEQAAGMK